ncbi:hypothetical protein BH09BAC5_BH09BAC5_19070 [soil metagenome]
MGNKIELEFKRPFTFEEIIALEGDERSSYEKRGVYIWGFTDGCNKIHPYYVGKHENSVLMRIKEHYMNLHFGNKYTILSEDVLSKYSVNISLKNIPSNAHPENEFKKLHDGKAKGCQTQAFTYLNYDLFFRSTLPSDKIKGIGTLKDITAQSIDLHNSISNSNQKSIQKVIDKYFGIKSFVCVFVLPKNKAAIFELGKLESFLKSELLYNTISRASAGGTDLFTFDKTVLDAAILSWFR